MILPVLNVLFEVDGSEQPSIGEERPTFEPSTEYVQEMFYYYSNEFREVNGQEGMLVFLCILVLISSLLSNLFRYLSAIIVASIRSTVVSNLRNGAFTKITSFHVGYFTENRKGDLMTRITNDITIVDSSIVTTVKGFIKEPILLIGYLIALISISPQLTLFALVVLPLSGVIISTIAKTLKKAAGRSMRSLDNMTNILDEAITGIRIIKGFNAIPYVNQKFGEEQRKFARQLIKMAERFELAGPTSEFLGASAIVVVMYVGGSIVLNHDQDLSAAGFILFLVFFSQILNPVKAITNSISTIQPAIVSGKRVFEIIDEEPLIKSKPNAIKDIQFNNRLEIKNADFAYQDAFVLKDLNLDIKKGKTYALVGPSGAGKSTLADLVPRFYDPKNGGIFLDDIDIRDMDIESYRSLFSIVTQESILFNDTVFNNIAFANQSATMEQVKEAARVANANEFIDGMENGYHTLIGERGAKLSGGQRQRLSIARAVLKNPEILILDEATSALDTESEKLVQDALNNLTKGRTSLVIAHRLSTIKNADQIIVMKEGQIVEKGTHQELVNLGGLYRKLTDLQTLT